ncbi:MAG TPA: molybdopterin-dependent oxidoreductase [Candidatus Saccharimonadaceae bacterium]|jgi:DMSO/TMAO reductase YedYZ molybdopterin-dependent catalytic subunit|nr:molybdopterin-dependent oxidoreductase [Candidatus Saccharimonadaceae bacterium]
MSEREPDHEATTPEPRPSEDPAPQATPVDRAAPEPAPHDEPPAPAPEPIERGEPVTVESGAAVSPKAPAPPRLEPLTERPEAIVERPRARLAAQSRRDFLLFGLAAAATAVGAWWLLPERTKARLAPGAAHDRLDTLASRIGLSAERRERVLNRALTFDDDVSEALYSKDRAVRTYDRRDVTPLRNNYDGRTPGPEYLATWSLQLSGLASGRIERLAIADLLARFPTREQVTRLVCVEGWSAIAWWGGLRFADLLAAYPPAPGARWAALRSAVNLDGAGRPDPYYVSIDLETAQHPQTLLATHFSGEPLPLAHGAPLRLLVPMKLGLKNIKAVTEIAYSAAEPPDYWNQRGYSKYDGL